MVYFTSFTVCSGDIKKEEKAMKMKKKTSENDQLTGLFSELFLFIFFHSPDPKSEKSRKSTNKTLQPKLFLLPTNN